MTFRFSLDNPAAVDGHTVVHQHRDRREQPGREPPAAPRDDSRSGQAHRLPTTARAGGRGAHVPRRRRRRPRPPPRRRPPRRIRPRRRHRRPSRRRRRRAGTSRGPTSSTGRRSTRRSGTTAAPRSATATRRSRACSPATSRVSGGIMQITAKSRANRLSRTNHARRVPERPAVDRRLHRHGRQVLPGRRPLRDPRQASRGSRASGRRSG